MAASARAITPTRTGPFPPPQLGSSILAAPFLPGSPRLRQSPSHSPQPREEGHQGRGASQASSLNAIRSAIGASKMNDTQISEPLKEVARSLVIPDSVTNEAMQTSPVSMSSSYGAVDQTHAPTATATDAPSTGPLAPDNLAAHDIHGPHPSGPGETPTNRSFTFPVPAPSEPGPRPLTRGMSMPMAGYHQNSPKSPSTKLQKCPYSSTDFTRHHNLKSHLLTHSQEKPYECTTCQARFRRLHDLKRHTKLHTGERPHTCPKCGRRFARGDALARHNKGQGGCAGRRSSFGIDEEGMDGQPDESMDGLTYHGDQGDDSRMDVDESFSNDDRRRESEPFQKRQDSGQSYQQHSSTYPPGSVYLPPGGNSSSTGTTGTGSSTASNSNSMRRLFPTESAGSSSREQPGIKLSPKGLATGISTVPFNANHQYAQGSMTESPKPISPGHVDSQHRLGVSEGGSLPGNRSPSMSQHLHQQQLARSASRSSSSMIPPTVSSGGPQLPSLSGLASSDARSSLLKQTPGQNQAPTATMLHQAPTAGIASAHGSYSSLTHAGASGSSIRDVPSGRESELWGYIRDLDARLQRSQEDYENRLTQMQTEITMLKSQLQQQNQQQNQQPPPPLPPPSQQQTQATAR